MMNYKLVMERRKTLSISVRNGEVTVKAPKNTSKEYIEKFVAQKSAWVEKKLAEYGKRVGVLGGALDYSQALIGGELVPIVSSSEFKKVRFENGAVHVPQKYTGDGIRAAVGNWYRRVAKESLCHTLEALSIRTGLKYKSFALTNAATKWGSCDGSGNIRLNWRLIMLDDALIEYVVIHELCHTVYHNHSKEFWAEVKKHCPSVATDKKRLKFYSPLTSLYR